MLKKSKLTKQIWYNDELWTVKEIISPNQHDDFILLERHSKCVYEDGSLTISMKLINAHDRDFYPNTASVRKLMRERVKIKELLKQNQGLLEQNWWNITECGEN